MNDAVACEFAKVTFGYRGDAPVLRNADLRLLSGEALCVAGANGAGKSTLINLVMHRLVPQSGQITVFGGELDDWRNRKRIGYVPQQSHFPPLAKVRNILDLAAEHYRFAELSFDLDAVVDALGLRAQLDKKCGSLSGGTARRLSLACALMHGPELAILDEPTAGLDREGRALLLSMLIKHREAGKALLWTTHNPDDVVAIDSSVAVIRDGEIHDWGSIWQRAQRQGKVMIEVLAANAPESFRDIPVQREGAVSRYLVPRAEADDFRTALVDRGFDGTVLPLSPEILMADLLQEDE